MKHIISCLLGLLALAAMLRGAKADVVTLANGGRIEGEWLNPDEKPRKTYVIKLPSGGQIVLEASQVKQVDVARPEMAEYEKMKAKAADTVDGQWNMAQWCKEHGLEAQRKTHLERIIELDPEHVQARRLLRYMKHEDGKWYTEEQWMRRQGYVPYQGGWKLPQEIEILEGKRKKELAEKEWMAKIKRWCDWLGGERNRQARENLRAIEDPAAVKSLAWHLLHDSNGDSRLLYIEILGKIRAPEAEATLAYTAMEDGVEEIRLSCLDVLQKTHSQQTIAYFIKRLRDKDNAMVNRAGAALARMKDPGAISPLIEALVTIHRHKTGSGNPGQMTMGFPTGGSRGGGGMSFGDSPKVIAVPMQNPSVLDALVATTGQNFSYDQRAWKTWYINQTKTPTLDSHAN